MLWDLVQRLTGQLRLASGTERLFATGLDMTAALALAAGLGIPPRLAAEFLPDIESALVAAINQTDDAEMPEGVAQDV
ncbi:tail assembly chaperone [Nostoc phage Nsp-JY21]